MPTYHDLFGRTGGFTLVELVTALFLLSLSLSLLLPAAGRQVDWMAVRGARDEVAGLLHRTRGEAVSRGGAQLVLSVSPPMARVLAGEETLAGSMLEEIYGVSMTLSRGQQEVIMAFGPLGLGRVASQTLRFKRGEAEAVLVVSSLGRVVRK